MLKTYAWINATAISKTSNRINPPNNRVIRPKFKLIIGNLIKVINKCPATKFAAKRTDRVIGRIKFLINSISTIKGIKA